MSCSKDVVIPLLPECISWSPSSFWFWWIWKWKHGFICVRMMVVNRLFTLTLLSPSFLLTCKVALSLKTPSFDWDPLANSIQIPFNKKFLRRWQWPSQIPAEEACLKCCHLVSAYLSTETTLVNSFDMVSSNWRKYHKNYVNNKIIINFFYN